MIFQHQTLVLTDGFDAIMASALRGVCGATDTVIVAMEVMSEIAVS